MAISENSTSQSVPAVRAENTAGGVGVSGVSSTGRGVEGSSVKGVGVVGLSQDYRGIEGRSVNEHGILGSSTKGAGVVGISESYRGVSGRSTQEHGVFGESAHGAGVAGLSAGYRGVSGRSTTGVGVFGISEQYEGVHAESTSTTTAALAAFQNNPSSTGAALYAKHAGSGLAALFAGPVHVAGALTCTSDVQCQGDVRLTGADLAEQFEVTGPLPAQPGSVMVLAGSDAVQVSSSAYDTKVAGVISGAGNYRPAVGMDDRESRQPRAPLALNGKVWVLVDAEHGAVRCGDLLTTSPTPGHAMRATDPHRAFGAVIGKALDDLTEGKGLIRALVSLQ